MSRAQWTEHRYQTQQGTRRKPGWCVTHQEFAWGWPDGSVGCFYNCIVEGAYDCEFVAGVLSLPRGTPFHGSHIASEDRAAVDL